MNCQRNGRRERERALLCKPEGVLFIFISCLLRMKGAGKGDCKKNNNNSFYIDQRLMRKKWKKTVQLYYGGDV